MKEKFRCGWLNKDPLYVAYHDKEWGVPLLDDQLLFEFLTLESAQAGLSWYTVLKKRENYRKAFANFDPKKVSKFTEAHFEKLMQNAGIIRNARKHAPGKTWREATRILNREDHYLLVLLREAGA